jgi:hypothetical protein
VAVVVVTVTMLVVAAVVTPVVAVVVIAASAAIVVTGTGIQGNAGCRAEGTTDHGHVAAADGRTDGGAGRTAKGAANHGIAVDATVGMGRIEQTGATDQQGQHDNFPELHFYSPGQKAPPWERGLQPLLQRPCQEKNFLEDQYVRRKQKERAGPGISGRPDRGCHH